MNNFHEVLIGLLINAVWYGLLFLIRASVSRSDEPAAPGRYSLKTIKRQFYICLAVVIVSVCILAAVRAESVQSLRFPLKGFAALFGGLAFLMLTAAFDAAVEYQRPEDEFIHRKGDQSESDVMNRE